MGPYFCSLPLPCSFRGTLEAMFGMVTIIQGGAEASTSIQWGLELKVYLCLYGSNVPN